MLKELTKHLLVEEKRISFYIIATCIDLFNDICLIDIYSVNL